MRRSVRLAAALAAAVAAIALVAGPAGAGANGNMITVLETVSGSVPAGTTFTVSVSCSGGSFKGGPFVMTFNETGALKSAQNVLSALPASITCTATETVDGGASSVTYACVATGTRATCPDGATGSKVQFVDVTGSSGTVTVTNTFPTPTPTPPVVPAAEVVAAPVLTG